MHPVKAAKVELSESLCVPRLRVQSVLISPELDDRGCITIHGLNLCVSVSPKTIVIVTPGNVAEIKAINEEVEAFAATVKEKCHEFKKRIEALSLASQLGNDNKVPLDTGGIIDYNVDIIE